MRPLIGHYRRPPSTIGNAPREDSVWSVLYETARDVMRKIFTSVCMEHLRNFYISSALSRIFPFQKI